MIERCSQRTLALETNSRAERERVPLVLAAGLTGASYVRVTPGRADLVSRIKCLPSDEADQPELANLCELEVVLRSGVRKTVRVEYHRGHFKNPMTDAEMEEKFRLMAQKHLPADRVDNLLRVVWSVEKEPQVSNLITATRV